MAGKPRQFNRQVAVSADGRYSATGGGWGDDDQGREEDYPIQLWELATGQQVGQLSVHGTATSANPPEAQPRGPRRHRIRWRNALAFSRDGRWLASGGARGHRPVQDATLRLWDLAALVPRYRFQGHRDSITSVAFATDDHWLASASEDATVLIWDVAQLVNKPRAAVSALIELERLWSFLGGDDAARAYRAVWTLAAAPDRAVPFLAERLKPIWADDPKKDTLLGPIASRETMRRLRAIAVLEKAGTPEAQRVLERLASGLEGARETPDARASLRRLGRK